MPTNATTTTTDSSNSNKPETKQDNTPADATSSSSSLPAVDPTADPYASLSTTSVPRLVTGWIDVHAHFYPPTSTDAVNKRWRSFRDYLFMTPTPPVWNAEATLRYMDAAGIQMQLLSNIPKTLELLRQSNDYGAEVVGRYPTRFGLLAALPTDDCEAGLAELKRVNNSNTQHKPDGYAVTTHYNNHYLSDPLLTPLWTELNNRSALVFIHPDAYSPPSLGRPSPVIEVAFDTTRTLVDMLYTGWFRRYPNIRVVVAHCGACLPALAGRLQLLGCEQWVPNPERLTSEEIEQTLAGLYVDTAAMGSAHSIKPVLEMTSAGHVCYGSDCGVPCTTSATMTRNLELLLASDAMRKEEIDAIGTNVLKLLPSVVARLKPKEDEEKANGKER